MSDPRLSSDAGPITPGETIFGDGTVTINEGRPVLTVRVDNTGDRPIQVGSHFHFAEANPALTFDRSAARGRRLAIPAGTSVRFEPGIGREVELVELAGARYIAGFRGEVGGPLDNRGGAGSDLGGADDDQDSADG